MLKVVTTDDARALVGLADYIEGRFPSVDFVPGPVVGRSPTGEKYVELADTEWQPSREAVIGSAKEHFNKYAEGKTGKLYWRVKPEIGRDEKGWKYYMRLLISDKEEGAKRCG